MKKVIALVLTLAMLVSCFAFSASAATAPTLELEGASTVLAGDTYTVNVRLKDADNQVGGFQGSLVYANATVDSIVVNPQVLGYNNTDDATTVIKDDKNGTIKFATVADLKGTNPATKIWFKVTFTVEADPTFTLADVVFSDKAATVLTGNTGVALAPEAPVVDEAGIEATLQKVGILGDKVLPNDQAISVKAGIVVPEGKTVDEIGVVFKPTSLLGGKELTVDTEGAVVASLKSNEAGFDTIVYTNKEFSGNLYLNFATAENAAKFMGTKVTARVYYKVGDAVYYSNNSVDKYIKNGIASKAVLNTVLDIGNAVETPKGSVSKEAFDAAKVALNTTKSDWQTNRELVLKYAVENA